MAPRDRPSLSAEGGRRRRRKPCPRRKVERVELLVRRRRGREPHFRHHVRGRRGGLGLGCTEVYHRLKLEGPYRGQTWFDVRLGVVPVDAKDFFFDFNFSLDGFRSFGRIHN